jgi:hypothetical protein
LLHYALGNKQVCTCLTEVQSPRLPISFAQIKCPDAEPRQVEGQHPQVPLQLQVFFVRKIDLQLSLCGRNRYSTTPASLWTLVTVGGGLAHCPLPASISLSPLHWPCQPSVHAGPRIPAQLLRDFFFFLQPDICRNLETLLAHLEAAGEQWEGNGQEVKL